MRHDIDYRRFATSLSDVRNGSLKLLALVILLFLAALAVGCGSALAGSSPSSHADRSSHADSSSHANRKSSPSEITVSVPTQTAKVGVAYNAVPSVSGGTAPYLFSSGGGSRPP